MAFAEERERHLGQDGFLLTTDGGHLNPRGHQLVADRCLKAWGMAT